VLSKDELAKTLREQIEELKQLNEQDQTELERLGDIEEKHKK